MPLQLALKLFALEFKRAFAYRAEFWMGFLGNALSQFGVAYCLWAALFRGMGLTMMQGFTLRDMALYYLLIPLVERVVMGPEMNHISGEIYDGTLTRYLIYPVAFFRFKYVSAIAQSVVFAGQMLALVAIFLLIFGVPPAYHITASGIALALLASAFGTLLYFVLSACLEMIAFWADNVWSLMVLNKLLLHFLGGGLLPLAFFPNILQTILKFTPFPYIVSFPLRFVMGTMTSAEMWTGFGVMIFWICAFSLFASRIWQRGLRQYAGVGI